MEHAARQPVEAAVEDEDAMEPEAKMVVPAPAGPLAEPVSLFARFPRARRAHR